MHHSAVRGLSDTVIILLDNSSRTSFHKLYIVRNGRFSHQENGEGGVEIERTVEKVYQINRQVAR